MMIKACFKKIITKASDLLYCLVALVGIQWKKGYDNPLKRVIKRLLIIRAWGYYIFFSRDQLKALRNVHKGERCFIICNGPSLNKLDLSHLRNEVTFGVNSIYLKADEVGFMPTYYTATDYCVLEDRMSEIDTLVKSTRFLPIEGGYCIRNKPGTIWINSPDSCGDFEVPSFSKIPELFMFHGSTITYTCMQLAYHMGFDQVYLIGCDNDYKKPASIIEDSNNWTSTEDDPNHFCPNYFGKGYRWNIPRTDLMERAYRLADWTFRESGRCLKNATAGGKLECLERVDYNDLFR